MGIKILAITTLYTIIYTSGYFPIKVQNQSKNCSKSLPSIY